MRNENTSLENENRELKIKAVQSQKQVDKTIDRVNKVLSKIPDDAAKQFKKAWNLEFVVGRGYDR